MGEQSGTGTNTDQPVTLTREQLDKWYEERRAAENMSEDEKRIRSVVREEVGASIREFFESIDPNDPGNGGAGDGGGGLWESLSKWLSPDEPANT